MEQNKLDIEFRKKLQERTIAPSPMAWDRLDAMLSVAEEKKQPKKRTWMYVAASFLGFLLVGTIFLKHGSDKGSNTVIKSMDAVVAAPAVNNNTGADAQTVPSVTESITETTAQMQNQPVQVASLKKFKIVEEYKCGYGELNVQLKETSLPQEQQAVAENTVKEKQIINNDAEELLNNALAQNQPAAKKSIKVDSKSLLSSVEGELDQSFKEKALQGAIKNFNAIKTSVANRNHR